ncbi:MAG TPA: NAD(P)-dependent oxidoreductase [Candidatus Dormibacteraeota bacterium]|nr:NAD(P)-dependent oxidoreductase [Candidatus Dormibacteraeota bacterium]
MTVDASAVRIGWIGTGVMGAAMCGHLLDRGHPTTVFTRTAARAAPLLARGAAWADSPGAAAEGADVVFTMVGFPHDVREVVLGADGALAGAAAGAVLVDMTTSEPALAREIDAAARARRRQPRRAGIGWRRRGAREARLSIMVGGEPAVFARVRPLFECLGRTIVLQGPAGSGQHAKLVNQILIASNLVAIAEGLLYAHRAGLDLPTVLASVAGGAASSFGLSTYVPRALAGDFAPGFAVDHFVKDMGIALAEARRMRLALPGLALAESLYVALQAHGHGRSGSAGAGAGGAVELRLAAEAGLLAVMGRTVGRGFRPARSRRCRRNRSPAPLLQRCVSARCGRTRARRRPAAPAPPWRRSGRRPASASSG